MVHYQKSMYILIMMCVFLGCSKGPSTVDSSSTPPTGHPTKSSKRGIAYNIPYAEDLAAIQKGVSWWYNWGMTPQSTVPTNYYNTYGMDFVPMLWGGNTSAFDSVNVENFILAHAEVQYLLVMNEPNLTDQSNRTPAQAATDWPRYEGIVSDLAKKGRTVYLVGPAMTWGTMTGYSNPVVWLDDFYTYYQNVHEGRKPKIDYLAFHWYDYGLDAQLNNLQKYGKKIWITEMANWNAQINSYAKQEAQMQSMVDTCERRSDVFRYAWFIGRGSGTDNHYTWLFTSTAGQLSELGKLYISLPFDTLQQSQ